MIASIKSYSFFNKKGFYGYSIILKILFLSRKYLALSFEKSGETKHDLKIKTQLEPDRR